MTDGTTVTIQVRVNGQPVEVAVEPRTSLADFLRDDRALTGTHLGCEHGICGACTVIVDGEAIRSCLLLAVQADGASVETVESLTGDGALAPLQQAFVAEHGLQCGYCTPGILMAVTAARRQGLGARRRRGGAPRRARVSVHGLRRDSRRGTPSLDRGRPVTSTEVSRPSLVGSRVARTVDARLLRGNGRFVADITRPGMLHAHILRSPLAAAEVARIDPSAAVGAGAFVLHALDDHGLDALPCVWLQPDQRQVDYPVLETHVRYVGQPVGIVVAGSRAVAEDLAELVDVAFDQTTAIVRDAQHALAPDAPLVRPELGTNVCVELVRGDPWPEVNELIEGAAHVVRRRLRIQRVAGHPLETRGVVAEWDAQFERLTVWMSSQAVHHAREHLSVSLGLRPDQIHVIAPDVGGAFGTKEHVYPDEVLVCAAALRTGRPVKWVEDRYEHFTATLHARDQTHDAVLALDADGRFLALWSDFVHDLGAHPSNVGSGPAQVASNMLQGPYRIDRAGTRARCVLTNRTPTGAYRGFGMQQAAWVRERLVDEAARELGIDPVELRERNMLRSDELPFTTRFLPELRQRRLRRRSQAGPRAGRVVDVGGRRRA